MGSGRIVASLHRNRLGTALRDEHDHRSSRFRLGDKKEAAGGAVAVISLGCMEIE
jgi:hypothetical protein